MYEKLATVKQHGTSENKKPTRAYKCLILRYSGRSFIIFVFIIESLI